MKRQDSRSTSSCAACKLLKRKCTPNCIFAPHFQSDEVHQFAKIHKVFGASNASKILNEVPQDQRGETVKSLVYEAEARLNDPVHGCIGAMALLQNRRMQLQHDLAITRAHLACYANTSIPLPPPEQGRLNYVSFNDYHGIRTVESHSDIPSSLELLQPDGKLNDPYGIFCQP